MRVCFLFFLFFVFDATCNEMDKAKNNGIEFSNKESIGTLEAMREPQELFTTSGFSEEAADLIRNGDATKSPLYTFLKSKEVRDNQSDKHFDENEAFIIRSEEIIENPYVHIDSQLSESVEEVGAKYEMVKCQKPADAYPLSYTRSLQLQVQHVPEKKVKSCKGHSQLSKRYKKREGAEDVLSGVKRHYSSNPQIKSWKAYIIKHYHVYSEWVHIDNSSSCDSFEEKIIQNQGVQEISQTWTSEDPNIERIASGPECSKIEVVCLDKNDTKIVNGLSVSKPCWKEMHLFLCKSLQEDSCFALKSKRCELIKELCIESSLAKGFCKVWERHFRCSSSFKQYRASLVGDSGIYALDGQAFDDSYEESSSFTDVITKLSVFDEIHKEIQASGKNVDDITIFGGSGFRCKKSVLNHAFYDCCTSLKGMAMSAGLRDKCSAEEQTLSQRKENGLCHYVGKYDEKEFGIKKSTVEMFCCFPTKLSRVLHEQGREQLNRGWGSARSPNCTGFSYEEISQLDFSKIDLEEVFEDKIKSLPDIEEKLNAFETRLQDVQSSMQRAKLQRSS